MTKGRTFVYFQSYQLTMEIPLTVYKQIITTLHLIYIQNFDSTSFSVNSFGIELYHLKIVTLSLFSLYTFLVKVISIQILTLKSAISGFGPRRYT